MHKEMRMRTTVTLDDELLAKAARYSGLEETSAIIRHALRDYVSAEASRRLARLGGTMPDFEAGPRKRPWGVEED
jgi:Arc/MetJ family transcription regulator